MNEIMEFEDTNFTGQDTFLIDGEEYTLRGPMTTPYAIIEGGELKECARYYTFHSDPEKHKAAFATHLLKWCPPGAIVITGTLAALLYTAVKGYEMEGPNGSFGPEDASREKAIEARDRIGTRALLSGDSDAILAQESLERWGPVIRPWAWTTKLTPEGRVIWDCPEYHQEIPLDGLTEAESGP